MSWLNDDIVPDPSGAKPRIVALRQVSDQYLVQWLGRTDDHRPIYLRFKDYSLSVRIGPIGGDEDSAIRASPWLDIEDVDVIDYWTIPLETVIDLTGVIVDCVVDPLPEKPCPPSPISNTTGPSIRSRSRTACR